MDKQLVSMESFAKMIYQLQRSDRDVITGVGGFTGEGKSTFTIHLCRTHGQISGLGWSLNNMTWSRKELLTWIDGKPDGQKLASGLIEGQKPEYSAINPDELFLMFYKRNWQDQNQIEALATLNMFRDRHLFVIGNMPSFWDLDSAFLGRVRFYVYIPSRGIAWVFEQELNPFSRDVWNVNKNMMLFRKIKNPYMLPNFLFEIRYNDLSPADKEAYLNVRTQKRVKAVQESGSDKQNKYSAIKWQRDNAVKFSYIQHTELYRKLPVKLRKEFKIEKPSYTLMADKVGCSMDLIKYIIENT